MTTAPAISPLETYQKGRDAFLAVVLDAVSGLEGSVLAYQHGHEGAARAAGTELATAQSENRRLQTLVGEQAEELETSRTHVCPVPDTSDFVDALAAPVEAAAPAAALPADTAAAEEAARTIEGLRAGLAAEKEISAGLRADLAAAGDSIERLTGDLAAEKSAVEELQGKLAAAADEVRGIRESVAAGSNDLAGRLDEQVEEVRRLKVEFDARLQAETAAASAAVRTEALRIIESIAADNPNLNEVAEMFSIAFPADNTGTPAAAAPAPEPVQSFTWSPPPAVAAATPVKDIPVNPETQGFGPLGEDAILDPDFFNDPQPLEAPEDEAAESAGTPAGDTEAAPVPKPGYGIFGRKKEAQGA